MPRSTIPKDQRKAARRIARLVEQLNEAIAEAAELNVETSVDVDLWDPANPDLEPASTDPAAPVPIRHPILRATVRTVATLASV